MEVEKRLTNEPIFFLETLSEYVSGLKTTVQKDLDISVLTDLANAQQLSPIIFYQTKFPPLQPAFASAFYHAVNRKKLLEKIDKEFNAGCPDDRNQTVDYPSPIQYLVFKGLEVSQYYPHPNLRTSGDIDLLVHKDDKENAGRILEELGFSCSGKGADH